MQRPRRPPACPTCSRSVRGRAARFCGWCGAPLTAATDRESITAPPRYAPGDTSRYAVLATIALLVVAGFAATVQSAGLMGASQGERTEDVNLTDEATGAPLEAAGELAEEQRAELRSRAAGSRLRCEPRGCERWRLTLGEEWARIGTTDGHVIFLRDRRFSTGSDAWTDGDDPSTELLVIDAQTGQEIVRRALEIRPSPRGEQPGSFAATVMPGGIALAIDGTIVALDLEGVIRWQRRPTDEPIWYLRSHGDRLLVFSADLQFRGTSSEGPGAPWEAGMVHVLEGGSGALQWSAPGQPSGTLDDEVAVVTTSIDGGPVTRAHDLDDGRVRWERDTAQVVHTAPERRHVILASGQDGAGDVLVDAHTGREVLTIDGTLITTTDQTDDRSYLLVDRVARDDGDRGPVVHDDSDLVVLALDADGQPIWRTEVEASLTGYARLSASADQLALIGDRGVAVGFDLASGEVEDVEPPLDAPAGEQLWTDADGRAIRQTADGVRIESSAGWVQVRGEHGAWLVANDPLLVTDGATLLAVDPVPG